MSAAQVPWEYRSSGLAGSVVVGATVQLTPADPKVLQKEITQHFRWRKDGTPFNERCCGSVFRNPAAPGGTRPGASVESRTAGQLIDALGLKGDRVGGAQVSPKHANYIVNTGDATAGDVLALIEQIRGKVFAEYGVELQLEVKVIE